jgi:tRNA A-37 threonylcarbamoyl transferase component Bud32
LEFDNALALRKRGVPAVEPLAWGTLDSNWPCESFLITQALTATVPFLHCLEHVLPSLPAEESRDMRRKVARAFGEFLAKLHDAGITHPDPHPGNLLVELAPDRPPQFALIDLHAVHVGKALRWRESRNNLVLFNRWFQIRASRADRSRFWHAYRRARATLPAPTKDELRIGVKELERDTHSSNLRFWAGRESRCLGTNRYFRKFRRGVYRGFAVRDLANDFLQQLLAEPDTAFARAGVRILKDSRTSTVAVLEMPGPSGPVPVVLKRVNVRSSIEPAKNVFRRSHVLRSWVYGHALRDRWLSSPRPLAVFHRYRNGLPAEGYLLTEFVPEPAPLRTGSLPSLMKLARLLRVMHDRGVSHRDLKAANILLAHGTEPTLIDLVGVRTRVQLSDVNRAKELARLNASFLTSPTVRFADRLRFLRAYLSAGTQPQLSPGAQQVERADWKTWWKMISDATATKVAKNRRQGRTLG